MATYLIKSTIFGVTRLYTIESAQPGRVEATQDAINKYNQLIELCEGAGNIRGIEHNTIDKLTYMDYVGMEELDLS